MPGCGLLACLCIGTSYHAQGSRVACATGTSGAQQCHKLTPACIFYLYAAPLKFAGISVDLLYARLYLPVIPEDLDISQVRFSWGWVDCRRKPGAALSDCQRV